MKRNQSAVTFNKDGSNKFKKEMIAIKANNIGKDRALYISTVSDRIGFGLSASILARFFYKSFDDGYSLLNCLMILLSAIILLIFCSLAYFFKGGER